eukprot:11915331-Ditylum_brightwellii.AAC.1
MDKVRKVINKEDSNCYLIPIPCWMMRFIPHMHVTPQGLIIKPVENDRLVFDDKFHSMGAFVLFCSQPLIQHLMYSGIEGGNVSSHY